MDTDESELMQAVNICVRSPFKETIGWEVERFRSVMITGLDEDHIQAKV